MKFSQLKEFRLGNFVQSKEVVYKVIGLFKAEIICETLDGVIIESGIYKPIPITEEWLLKLGFVSSDINNSIRIHFEHCTDYRFEYYITKIPNYHKEDMYFSGSSITNIKYVHQLQNLYFALTGEELTLSVI